LFIGVDGEPALLLGHTVKDLHHHDCLHQDRHHVEHCEQRAED